MQQALKKKVSLMLLKNKFKKICNNFYQIVMLHPHFAQKKWDEGVIFVCNVL